VSFCGSLLAAENNHNTHHNRFMALFSGITWVSQCQKKASSGLYGAREDNKKQTHRQSGLAPLHPDQSAGNKWNIPFTRRKLQLNSV